MATSSEIQVTEAYIGLLGRAPDPAGLAYWVKELDAAIAAGEDPAVALKKLTNDITLNDEWLVDGDGAYDVTGGTAAANLANAETVVGNMYDRLFDRAAKQAELDYWAPKLVSGEFTSSEMAVALVQGAGSTDGDVLGYKQEAATYYVENVAQADFDKTAAGNSVADVNGPISLNDSKTATDYISTGVGETSALTTKDGDAITVTAGDDVATGIKGTMQTNDTMKDLYTSDNDSLTLTETKGFTFGTVTNVENIAVNIEAQLGTDLTIEANNASGGTITVDVAPTVEVAGIDVLGETIVTMNDVASNVVTTDVTSLTLNSLDADISVSGDADLKTVAVSGMNDSGTSIILDNNDSSVTLTGADGTNDAAHVSAVGKVAIDANGATDVDYLTVSGNGGAVVATLSNADGVTNYTIAGSQDVTLKGDNDAFDGSTLTDSSTAGAANVAITGGANADLSKWAAVDSLSIAGNMDASATVTYKAGDLTATVDATQDAADELVLQTNDVTASSTATLELTLNNDVGELSTGTSEANDFDIVNIGTGAKPRTIDEIDMDGNDTALTIVGQNDITVTLDAAAGTVHIETTKDVAADGVAAATGFVTITADAINITNDVTATNDAITLTATNEVSVDDVTVSGAKGGNVDITGATVTANDITAGNDVMLTATNDTAASTTNDVLAEGDISIDSGKWTIASLTANDGTLTLSGDAKVTATSSNATDGITVTSSCDVDLGAIGNDATVLNASGATGGVTANFDGTYASQVTVVTNTGADDITADCDVVFNINTGAGNDTVTIETAAALSVVNTGAGDDTIVANDTGNDYSVYAGDGNDSITVVASGDAAVYGNDGDDTFTVGADSAATITGGNDTDTVVLAANDYSDDKLVFSGIEKVNVTAGDVTLSAATVASDNTFELVGNGTNDVTLTVVDANDTTIDASGITTGGFSAAGLVIEGNAGNDTLTASDYSDTINGGNGKDKITGGASTDGGNDILNGNDGDDTIDGLAGIDEITGGAGNDVIDGGAGNDTITGGADQDTMTGGAGSDTFVFLGGASNDGAGLTNSSTALDATNEADVITDFATGSGNDSIDLTTANDTGAALGDQAADIANGASESWSTLVTAVETSFGTSGAGNDVYVSYDAMGTGNAYVFVDSDNDGILTDNDIVIILTGIDQANEIDATNDFTFT